MTQRIHGVLSPVVTPFKADLSPDKERFIAHCKWLLSQNCGLAVLGTNSEANSLAAQERSTLLDAGDRQAHSAGGKAWCRGCLDAAAFLLQGCQRRRSLPPLQ